MTKSHSCRPIAADKTSWLTEFPLSLDDAVRRVFEEDLGAVVTFSGTIRKMEKGRPIASIAYQAYSSMAEKEISRIVGQAKEFWAVKAEVKHRLGKVAVGESSLMVACSAVHRREAFEACRFIVDKIKREVPIWKVGYEWT